MGDPRRMWRRHPGQRQLERWFDDEGAPAIGWHIGACPRCAAYVEHLGLVAEATRHHALAGATSVKPVARPARSARRRLVVVATPVAAAVLAAGVAGATLAGSSGSRGAAHRGSGPTTSLVGHPASAGAAPTGVAPSGESAGGRSTSTGGVGASGLLGRVLKIAVIVPTTGPAAAAGAEIVQAERDAIAQADAAGGVGGHAVQLVVVPAENSAAVAGLAGQVDAVVGGFGASAPAGVPWLLPADPWASGPSVVAAELSPEEAGAFEARAIAAGGVDGPVGVVVGSGPDAALAQGIASVLPVDQVPVTSTDCAPAVSLLRTAGVVAVAVAGDPSLAAACAEALTIAGWSPPAGMLVPPSAAYDDSLPAAAGAETVLGLPWPSGASPGAARFRAAAPGVADYQALVSFAAVELAVQVAQADGGLTLAQLAAGNWRNDLYDFAGTTDTASAMVRDGSSGWVPAG